MDGETQKDGSGTGGAVGAVATTPAATTSGAGAADAAKTGAEGAKASTTMGQMAADAGKKGAEGDGKGTEGKGNEGAQDPAKKAADEKAAADAKAQADAEAKAKEVPEEYDFKLPDNFSLDKELVEEFTPFAKELKLNQGNAQKVVDMGVKLVEKTQKAVAEANQKEWDDARDKWLDETKNDKEVGGAKYEESKELANRAIRWLGIPDLQQVFDTGWGENPALFKAFVKVGKALGEDVIIDGQNPTEDKPLEYKLYPTMR